VAYAAYAHFGPYWPTAPDIEPGTAGSLESSPASPFLIINKSILFTIKDAKFTCYLKAAEYKIGDEKGWVLGILKPAAANGWQKKAYNAVDIKPGTQKNYVCDPFEMIRDVHINYQDARLRGFQVTIAVDYVVDLPWYTWHRHIASDTFTCDVTNGKCHWMSGEFID
jgi:hypothetical protein